MTLRHKTKSDHSSLRTEIVRSIRDIDPALWDSVGASQGLYWTHRFFSCVESSGSADASYWYILFYEQNTLVATAVLSRFIVSLDLLLPSPIQRAGNIIRRFWPSFLRLPMIFCGVPVSIGKHTIAVANAAQPEAILPRLNREMEHIAAAEGIRYLCFKEFTDGDLPALQLLEHFDFMRARSIPRVNLKIQWSTFSEYLLSMRHGYRRKIRQSLRKIGITSDTSPIRADVHRPLEYPRLIVIELNGDNAGQMHNLYMEVMRRAGTKLEILPREFFNALAREMNPDLVLLGLEHRGELLGAALLGCNETHLNFLFAGLNYSFRDQYQTYFNLLNGIIAFGIEKRFENIDLGQTTYTIKQRLGGVAEPMYFYLRALSPPINLLLRLLNRLLFPETKVPRQRIFHNSDS
jgi:predicted N-acyltransferase